MVKHKLTFHSFGHAQKGLLILLDLGGSQGAQTSPSATEIN